MNTKIICVYNNPEIFEKVVKNNEYLKNSEIIAYDNTSENIPITKRYNNFIEEIIARNANYVSCDNEKDFWCLFIHQDFGILEDIDLVLEKLNKKFIYGAIGVKYFPHLYCNRKGFKWSHLVCYGKFLQGNNDFNFLRSRISGKELKQLTMLTAAA